MEEAREMILPAILARYLEVLFLQIYTLKVTKSSRKNKLDEIICFKFTGVKYLFAKMLMLFWYFMFVRFFLVKLHRFKY